MKKRYFCCNKLVRDRIPEILLSREIEIQTRMLQPHEKVNYLKEKVLEEAHELRESHSVFEIIEELVDVWEAMESLKRVLQITPQEFEKKKIDKKEKRGGFEEGICLEKIILTEDHPDIHYYLTRNLNYPEENIE